MGVLGSGSDFVRRSASMICACEGSDVGHKGDEGRDRGREGGAVRGACKVKKVLCLNCVNTGVMTTIIKCFLLDFNTPRLLLLSNQFCRGETHTTARMWPRQLVYYVGFRQRRFALECRIGWRQAGAAHLKTFRGIALRGADIVSKGGDKQLRPQDAGSPPCTTEMWCYE